MNRSSQPLYKVGEIVILCSKRRPELNGEYTIRCVHHDGDRYIDRVSKSITIVKLTHHHHAYRFSDVMPNGKGLEMLFCEENLRKRHTPGTVSFKRLMELV